MLRRTALSAAALATSVMVATTGHATAMQRHLQDGQLVYELNDPAVGDQIAYRVNPDGSGSQRVFDQPMECPHWSPDGTRIASCGGPDDNATTIVNVDTGATRFLPSVAPGVVTPCYVWSSDGERLACEGFNDDDPSRNGIFTVRVADWGDVRRLTTNEGGSDVPGDYSPNSHRMVFSRSSAETGATALFRINSNGTGLRQITPSSLDVGSSGSWSTRGNKILFSAHADADHRQSLWAVNSDGTDLRQVSIAGIPCGGDYSDPAGIGCNAPTWAPSQTQFSVRVVTPTGTELWRANADGSNPSQVVFLGHDSGESVDWGTHPLAAAP